MNSSQIWWDNPSWGEEFFQINCLYPCSRPNGWIFYICCACSNWIL